MATYKAAVKISEPVSGDKNHSESFAKAREPLLTECLFSSIGLLHQAILTRQKTGDRQTLLNELCEVLISTCRDPKFTMRIVALLPEEYRATLRLVVVFEFMHRFSLGQIRTELDEAIDPFIREHGLLRTALVRLVLAKNDEVFFYVVKHLEAKTFYFSIREVSILADTSDYDCGPGPNPGVLWDRNAHFFELVAGCGSENMQRWAEAFVHELFASK